MAKKDCHRCHGNGVYGNKDNECHECCYAGEQREEARKAFKEILALLDGSAPRFAQRIAEEWLEKNPYDP